MKEKIYNIKKDQLEVIHFTKEKIFCRLRSDSDDVNICWISDDLDFDKNTIVFSQLFNKKTKINNLIKNKNDFIKLLINNYSEGELKYVKEIFIKLYSSESLNTSLTHFEMLKKYDEYFYLSLFYFVIEKCKGNILKVNDITISFKNTNEFIAINFWDKFFK